nr:hypothetical protein [Tanacetum cinerariifolium]
FTESQELLADPSIQEVYGLDGTATVAGAGSEAAGNRGATCQSVAT